MSSPDANTPVRLKVSPEIARIVGPGVSREVQLVAARGTLSLAGGDLLMVLCFLCANPDPEVKGEAVRTLRALPLTVLQPVIADPALHPRLLDLLVRVRVADGELMAQILAHPAVADTTLHFLAERGDAGTLMHLAEQPARLTPALVAVILANSQVDRDLKVRLGGSERTLLAAEDEAEDDDAEREEEFPEAVDGDPDEVEEVSEETLEARLQEAETVGLSKHQLAMEMKVSEKIKMAMTGDKEWRNIFIKDPNKLVHGAVLKNGRMTEAEVVAVARSKTSSDEMIRLILLNRDWMKNSEIRKGLALHPKTPLPKALRFVSELPLNDLKKLMKSRNVSNAIVTTARKEVESRLKRGGG